MGMKVLLFGATGMVGQGTLRVLEGDPDVESVLCVGRRASGSAHPKVQDLLLEDLFKPGDKADVLRGWDACLWCLGISSVGLDEAAYARVTEELTLFWARLLLGLNPGLAFCYCSAAGAGGGAMWARVRQRVEGGLQGLPFRHVGCVRPAGIQPGPGIRSRVRLYNLFIVLFLPLFPLLVRALPAWFTRSDRLGRAMLRVAQGKADRKILESADINRLGA